MLNMPLSSKCSSGWWELILQVFGHALNYQTHWNWLEWWPKMSGSPGSIKFIPNFTSPSSFWQFAQTHKHQLCGKRSIQSLGFILWEPWMYVRSIIAIHLVLVEIFQSGAETRMKWPPITQTDISVPAAMPLAKSWPRLVICTSKIGSLLWAFL